MNEKNSVTLTSFNPGSGCGCKIEPTKLHDVLSASNYDPNKSFGNLIIGHEQNDDAAVLDLGNDDALVHSTDFFTPIVNDPFDFGAIAASNAISDVYAMGASPDMALAILGWPIDTLGSDIAGKVIAGAREQCNIAGIPLAGGHSIDIPQPIFGLSVTGRVKKDNLKTNSGAKPGDLLYLTKPLGIGIIATAMKKEIANDIDEKWALKTMKKQNVEGPELAQIHGVNAMTDVTGFGLAGHLHEMMSASNCSAKLSYSQVPFYDQGRLKDLYSMQCMPTGTTKNYLAYHKDIEKLSGEELFILLDPQTSGGLLVSVDPKDKIEVENILKENSIVACIGAVTEKKEKLIYL
jgi:selenide,water dikinase